MSIFAIADLHLSFGSDKPMDVFHGWENYTQKIETNWRNLVKQEDTVVVAGDISWAMSIDGAREDFAFLESLPGRKLIIKGNHDFWWDTRAKMDRFLESYGFDSIKIIHNTAEPAENVCICGTRGWFMDSGGDKKVLLREAGRLETSIQAAEKTGLEPIAFLHYPPVYGGYECEEITDVLKKHGIKRCYYGHLHGAAASTAIEGKVDGIIYRLISCDHIAFSPVRV